MTDTDERRARVLRLFVEEDEEAAHEVPAWQYIMNRDDLIARAIRASDEAALPVDVAGVVARMKSFPFSMGEMTQSYIDEKQLRRDHDEAADALTRLAAERDTATQRGRDEERERCAELVRTWAEDHKTVQPSFSALEAAIRDGGTG